MTWFHIGYFGWPLVIATTIFLNWYRIEKRKKVPVYFYANWSRAVCGFMALVCLTMDKNFDPANRFFYQMFKVLPEITFIVSSFYLFFDAGLNWLRNLHWDYRGEASGWTDSFKLAFYYVLKVVCLIAMIWSSVILWR